MSVLTWPGLPRDSCPMWGGAKSGWMQSLSLRATLAMIKHVSRTVWLNRGFWSLPQHGLYYNWMRGSCQLRPRTGMGRNLFCGTLLCDFLRGLRLVSGRARTLHLGWETAKDAKSSVDNSSGISTIILELNTLAK